MRQLLFFYFNSSLNDELLFGEYFMFTERKRVASTARTIICPQGYRRPTQWVETSTFAPALNLSLASAKLPNFCESETTHLSPPSFRNDHPV